MSRRWRIAIGASYLFGAISGPSLGVWTQFRIGQNSTVGIFANLGIFAACMVPLALVAASYRRSLSRPD